MIQHLKSYENNPYLPLVSPFPKFTTHKNANPFTSVLSFSIIYHSLLKCTISSQVSLSLWGFHLTSGGLLYVYDINLFFFFRFNLSFLGSQTMDLRVEEKAPCPQVPEEHYISKRLAYIST
jgi:hypothetical protein